MFEGSLCGVSASAEALQRFFTHSLTQTLTHKPRLTGKHKSQTVQQLVVIFA